MYRLDRNERDIGTLTELVSKTSETVHLFAEGMKHFSETFAAHEKKCEVETEKLNTLWENRSQIKGGYIVIATLCGLIVGGATVAGVVFELLKK